MMDVEEGAKAASQEDLTSTAANSLASSFQHSTSTPDMLKVDTTPPIPLLSFGLKRGLTKKGFIPSIKPVEKKEQIFSIEGNIIQGSDPIPEKKEAPMVVIAPLPEGEGPLLMRGQVPGLSQITNEKDKFWHDVNSRPDEPDPEGGRGFSVPVELYGEGMLRALGWEPGQAIGGSTKKVVEPIEYVPRHHRLGLGATPKLLPPSKKKIIKPGESRDPKPLMVLPQDADGRQRHHKTLDEKLVPYKPKTIGVGTLVSVSAGPHDGACGRVVSMQGQKARLRLVSDEEVEVVLSDLTMMNSTGMASDHPALAASSEPDLMEEDTRDSKKRTRDDQSSYERDRKRQRSPDDNRRRNNGRSDGDSKYKDDKYKDGSSRRGDREDRYKDDKYDRDDKYKDTRSKRSDKDRDSKYADDSRSRSTKDDQYEDSKKNGKKDDRKNIDDGKKASKPVVSWVRPGIVVRIASKSFREGKYYLKKVTVVEAFRDVCVLRLDDGNLLHDIPASMLQTVVPAVGKTVMVLVGEEAGKRVKLLDITGEASAVQTEDFEILTLPLDHISQVSGAQ